MSREVSELRFLGLSIRAFSFNIFFCLIKLDGCLKYIPSFTSKSKSWGALATLKLRKSLNMQTLQQNEPVHKLINSNTNVLPVALSDSPAQPKCPHPFLSHSCKHFIAFKHTTKPSCLKQYGWWWLYNSMSILKATDLCTLKGELDGTWIISQKAILFLKGYFQMIVLKILVILVFYSVLIAWL